MADSCLFCKIIAREIPGKMAGENDAAIAFHDISPIAPVHVLIVPREHIAGVHEIGSLSSGTVQDMLELANDVARDLGVADSGYRLVTNVGPDSGQTVFHLHWHLLGGQALTNSFA